MSPHGTGGPKCVDTSLSFGPRLHWARASCRQSTSERKESVHDSCISVVVWAAEQPQISTICLRRTPTCRVRVLKWSQKCRNSHIMPPKLLQRTPTCRVRVLKWSQKCRNLSQILGFERKEFVHFVCPPQVPVNRWTRASGGWPKMR